MSLKCWTAPGVLFETREELHEHYKSEWHKYNLKRKVAALQPVPLVMFEKLQQIALDHEKAKNTVHKGSAHIKKNKKGKRGGKDQPAQEPHQAEAPKAPVVDENEEAEEQDYEIDQEEFKKEIDPTVCFMDGNKSETLEENLSYMHKKYGFWVPDAEYCDDLVGLYGYCSKKIRAGKLCLLCDKPFKSGQAAMKHMVAKNHCKIPWEAEEDMEEYGEFYDYSPLDEDGSADMDTEGGASGARAQKLDVELLDSGEVILTDNVTGESKMLGHRDLRNTYKQRFKPEEKRPDVLAASKERLLLMYKQAGVETGTTLAKKMTNDGRPLWMNKKMAQRQFRDIQRQRQFQLRADMQQNLAIKNRQREKKNVGDGYGVHG
mmetsp:Transcript_17649/g.31118  ORF Transcript_17649/g.31118 Transcript_17649/m.31118 type:complete len:375 (+) Transcript_17649:128-1252(+)